MWPVRILLSIFSTVASAYWLGLFKNFPPLSIFFFFYWTLSIFMLVRLGCFIFISHCKKLPAFFFLLNPAPVPNCHPPLYKSFSFLTISLCRFIFIASKLQGTNAITIHLSLCFLFLNSKVMILLEDGNYLGW